jgi:cell division protein FtsI (penicillin-binding protein 3)
VASTSFGHGMNVSPLALAGAYGRAHQRRQAAAPDHPQAAGRRQGRREPRVVSEQTTATCCRSCAPTSPVGSGGKSADIKGLNVGGKTGTGEKYDPAIRRYSNTKQVSSFAAVFPTDGPTSDSATSC